MQNHPKSNATPPPPMVEVAHVEGSLGDGLLVQLVDLYEKLR